MLKISRESEINLINILIDQDIISGKDLVDIKKASSEGEKSQIEAVFELKLTDEQKILDLLVNEQSLDNISSYIDRLLADGETTMESIQKANSEKTKTFDYDVDENAEVLEEKPEEDIEAIENESDVIKFSTAVVAEAIKSGVSDIHIEPYRFSSRVRYRLDGILQEQEHFKKFLHSNYGAVVTRFKIMGKLDIAERRLPQDGGRHKFRTIKF